MNVDDIHLTQLKANLLDKILACNNLGEILKVIRKAEKAISYVETGNQGESNPGEVSSESNPGVSRSPPARNPMGVEK